MKFLVYGAGAVGGALAVRLRAAGADVSVIARGEHGDAIRARGLTLIAGDSTRTVQVPCVPSVEDVAETPDVVFVCVKQTQLPAIAASLGKLQAAGARVVLAMNGIGWWFADELPIPHKDAFVDTLDPGRNLRDAIDATRLIAAVVQSSNEVVEPGVIVGTTPTRNRMILGSVTRHANSGVQAICSALTAADYEAIEVQDIRREIWNKMALWMAVSPISAVTGLSLDTLTNDGPAFDVMAAVLREVNVIGRRLGFELEDDVDARIGFYRDKPTRTSLLKDLELGRAPELESGVMVFAALARALDVDAPHVLAIATLTRLRFMAMREHA